LLEPRHECFWSFCEVNGDGLVLFWGQVLHQSTPKNEGHMKARPVLGACLDQKFFLSPEHMHHGAGRRGDRRQWKQSLFWRGVIMVASLWWYLLLQTCITLPMQRDVIVITLAMCAPFIHPSTLRDSILPRLNACMLCYAHRQACKWVVNALA